MENKNTSLIVGNRIKQMRSELGLTQDELAKKIGLGGKSTIATYESGRNTPTDEVKLKLCKLFDCSMDYLMGLSDKKHDDQSLIIDKEEIMQALDVITGKAKRKTTFDPIIEFYMENSHKINEKDKKVLLEFLKTYFDAKEEKE